MGERSYLLQWQNKMAASVFDGPPPLYGPPSLPPSTEQPPKVRKVRGVRLAPQRKEQIRALLDQGMAPHEVAALAKASMVAVEYIVRTMIPGAANAETADTHPKKKPGVRIPEEKVEEIRQRLRKGEPVCAVATAYNLSLGMVYRIRKGNR